MRTRDKLIVGAGMLVLVAVIAFLGFVIGSQFDSEPQPTKSDVVSEAQSLEGCSETIQTDGRQVCSQELPAPNPQTEEPTQRAAPPVSGLGSSNGNIPASELSDATGCVTGLANRAAAAWNHVAVRTHKATGYWLQSNGPASCYRTFAQQVELRNYWCAHGACANAAVPGTSNHGWAIAVDAPPATVSAIHRFGGRYFGQGYGSCSDAPWESWHIKYCGGYGGRDPGPYGKHAGPVFHVIHRGVKGKDVKTLTTRLALLNPPGKAKHFLQWDNRGVRCQKPCAFAIRRFQRAAHLPADGQYGPKTDAKLDARWAYYKKHRHRGHK